MRTATVREFRDQATKLLKQDEPLIVTRHGKIIGFFLPASDETLPLEIKRDLFLTLTDELRSAMTKHRLSEDSILADFEKTRQARRRR